mgnify:CR=1 FL=1
MSQFQYDLVVIGAGSGGVRLANVAATLGASVAIVESREVGGTCVNVGCVPKKLMMYAARYSEEMVDAAGYGWNIAAPTFSWTNFLERKNTEIHRLNHTYEKRLVNNGVHIVHGKAQLVDSHTVEVQQEQITARYIAIATGSMPVIPDIPGKEYGITSNDAFFLPQLPKQFAIVGGGYVAVEFASIFNGMGCEVDLIVRGNRLLGTFDHELGELLVSELCKRGVKVHFQAELESIQRLDSRLRLNLRQKPVWTRDAVMFATGRNPCVSELGLEHIGVALNVDGSICVDPWGKTSVDSIYAIGDVTGGLGLTPVAIREGKLMAHTLFGERPKPLCRDLVPTAVFSLPAVAGVGLTEHEAHARKIDCVVYRTRFQALKHALSRRDEQTLVKLVVERHTNRVLGCHMLGPEAGEIIQGLAVALQSGATKAHFDATLGIHPTAAEEFVTMLN